VLAATLLAFCAAEKSGCSRPAVEIVEITPQATFIAAHRLKRPGNSQGTPNIIKELLFEV